MIEENVSAGAAPGAAIGDELREASAEVRSRAARLKRRVSERADEVRAAAADRLEDAAQVVHERADALAAGADYVRDHDVREMFDDVLNVVRNHPGPALIGAATLGFLVGRVLSRD